MMMVRTSNDNDLSGEPGFEMAPRPRSCCRRGYHFRCKVFNGNIAFKASASWLWGYESTRSTSVESATAGSSRQSMPMPAEHRVRWPLVKACTKRRKFT